MRAAVRCLCCGARPRVTLETRETPHHFIGVVPLRFLLDLRTLVSWSALALHEILDVHDAGPVVQPQLVAVRLQHGVEGGPTAAGGFCRALVGCVMNLFISFVCFISTMASANDTVTTAMAGGST